MFGGLCNKLWVSEQGKEQADTGHYKRKVGLILNIEKCKLVNQKAELLDKTLKKEVNADTLKFLNVLVERDRINLLETVIENYLALIYDLASVKIINVTVAVEMGAGLESALLRKLEELTNAREIRLVVTVDPSIIAGMIIKTKSQIIDFSYRNKLRLLAKHLDSVLEF